MNAWRRTACLMAAALMTWAAPGAVQARDDSATAALVSFNSDEGLVRLSRSTAKRDFPALANQFEAQSNIAFCGPTSAAIVLNALMASSTDLPRDRSRLRVEDLRYLPGNLDLSVPRFTQDNVFAKARKTRAQVLGEPIMVDGRAVRDPGFQVRQLDELLRANGAQTRLVIASEQKPDKEIREDLIDNLRRAGDYVIVNYKRESVGQKGWAHLSPIAAYDGESDSVLVMDVNPTTAGWVWMPLATLIKGMRTFDTVENRGYILVSACCTK